MLKNLREDIYGPNHRPFIYFEVIDMGGGSIRANHYSWMGRVTFVAINNDDYSPLDQWLQTGLPAGEYCDIVSGSLIDGRCTGKQVTVHQDGKALIQIGNLEQDPIIGLHINARLSA
ncbi:unnamed protein product [Rotaria sordida]|uniref:Alpha-amylase C-terminal domain-containing protein n=1 Tax=Rotaria sordida TaxID=392033 RepID=A0A819DX44_9BILA|nr:unnamed protein product [Rotaria sordida]